MNSIFSVKTSRCNAWDGSNYEVFTIKSFSNKKDAEKFIKKYVEDVEDKENPFEIEYRDEFDNVYKNSWKRGETWYMDYYGNRNIKNTECSDESLGQQVVYITEVKYD